MSLRARLALWGGKFPDCSAALWNPSKEQLSLWAEEEEVCWSAGICRAGPQGGRSCPVHVNIMVSSYWRLWFWSPSQAFPSLLLSRICGSQKPILTADSSLSLSSLPAEERPAGVRCAERGMWGNNYLCEPLRTNDVKPRKYWFWWESAPNTHNKFRGQTIAYLPWRAPVIIFFNQNSRLFKQFIFKLVQYLPLPTASVFLSSLFWFISLLSGVHLSVTFSRRVHRSGFPWFRGSRRWLHIIMTLAASETLLTYSHHPRPV